MTRHTVRVGTQGARLRPTEHQYRIMRFWAGNIISTRPGVLRYTETRSPAPVMRELTRNLLDQYGWMTWQGYPGYYVHDAGRRAIGLPPLGRDGRCPLSTCGAAVGERCVDLDGPYQVCESAGASQRWRFQPYTDALHYARQFTSRYERLAKEHALSSVRELEAMVRAEVEADETAMAGVRAMAGEFATGPHVGLITAT